MNATAYLNKYIYVLRRYNNERWTTHEKKNQTLEVSDYLKLEYHIQEQQSNILQYTQNTNQAIALSSFGRFVCPSPIPIHAVPVHIASINCRVVSEWVDVNDVSWSVRFSLLWLGFPFIHPFHLMHIYECQLRQAYRMILIIIRRWASVFWLTTHHLHVNLLLAVSE